MGIRISNYDERIWLGFDEVEDDSADVVAIAAPGSLHHFRGRSYYTKSRLSYTNRAIATHSHCAILN